MQYFDGIPPVPWNFLLYLLLSEIINLNIMNKMFGVIVIS